MARQAIKAAVDPVSPSTTRRPKNRFIDAMSINTLTQPKLVLRFELRSRASLTVTLQCRFGVGDGRRFWLLPLRLQVGCWGWRSVPWCCCSCGRASSRGGSITHRGMVFRAVLQIWGMSVLKGPVEFPLRRCGQQVCQGFPAQDFWAGGSARPVGGLVNVRRFDTPGA